MPLLDREAGTSDVLAIIRRKFGDFSDLELAHIARLVARGHAAHFAALRDEVPTTPRAREARRRDLRWAQDLDKAWAVVASAHALADLAEEYSPLSRALDRLLRQEVDRALREVYDPFDLGVAMPLTHLLPPRSHLPDRIPAALEVHYAPKPQPVRQRRRACAAPLLPLGANAHGHLVTSRPA